MSVAFATVGASAIYVVAGWTIQKERSENRNSVLQTASLMALNIDPRLLSDYRHDHQVATPLYRNLGRRLRAGMNVAKSLSSAFIVRGSADRMQIVLFATPPLGSEGAFVDFGKPSAALISAMQSGRSTVDDLPDKTRAYAPIENEDGTIDSAVVIDQPLAPLLVQEASFWKIVTGANFLVIILSFLFGGLIAQRTGQSVPALAERLRPKRNHWILRSGILEIVLLGMACTVMTIGIAGHLAAGKEAEALGKHLAQADAAQYLRDRADRVLLRNELSQADLGAMLRYAKHAEIDSAVAEIEANRDRVLEPGFDWRPFIAELIRASSRQTSTDGGIQQVLDSLKDRNEGLSGHFAIAACITLAALILIRAASRQQQALADAVEDSKSHRQIYRQLVNGLPIGLFTYKQGNFIISNDEWRTQMGIDSAESMDAVFNRAIAEGDRERVLQAITRAEDAAKPFTIDFSATDGKGQVRYFECRGVPILDSEGGLRHMLAFCADITQLEVDRQVIEAKNAQLADANSELQANLAAMVHLLVKAVEAKDVYTAGHSDRVTQYSLSIGVALGLSEAELRILEMGTRIHDVGKIGVPDAILNKPSYLSAEEYEFVRAHPVIGYEMIQDIPQFAECKNIVRWHHERLDGSGYPDRLSAEQIPLLVRIASVADVFDAITSVRAYKEGKSIEAALDELRADAVAGKLDLQIVEVFADIVVRDGMLPQIELQLPTQELAS